MNEKHKIVAVFLLIIIILILVNTTIIIKIDSQNASKKRYSESTGGIIQNYSNELLAIQETANAYYRKGVNMQYESIKRDYLLSPEETNKRI